MISLRLIDALDGLQEALVAAVLAVLERHAEVRGHDEDPPFGGPV